MLTQQPMELGSIAQWVAAGATLLAVLVALFREEIVSWWRRPVLDVSVLLSPPHCHATILQYQVQRIAPTSVQAQCYYFRLWVENRGRTRAERVQVFAAKLFRRVADGSFQEDKRFLPLNLRWAHGQARDGRGPEIYAEGISPKMGKHCDIGHITDPNNRAELGEDLEGVSSGKAIFALDLEVAPNTRSHLLAPGIYRLELRVAAGNSSPVTKVLEITVTGDWFADERKMFQDGIGLRVVA